MSNPKGTRFETALVRAFLEEGFPSERKRLRGSQDEGDLHVDVTPWLSLAVEARDRGVMAPGVAVDKAVQEATNACSSTLNDIEQKHYYPVAILKRRGYNVRESYVVMPVYVLLGLLSELRNRYLQ